MPFRNPLALLGLLSILPLMILYLIRPRPKEVVFSSILFLRGGEAERSAVLSRLISDPLFWIQLLILCSLSLAAAGPYTTDLGTASSHLVVVLDASASMESCFQDASSLILGYLDRYERISLVLAESIPVAALQEGSPAEARDTLGRIAPRAVSADLSSAMLLADNLLGPEGGDILVVSDFISWAGDDPEATRRVLESEGRSVMFADVYRGGDNVALIDGWDVMGIGSANHTAILHNFGRSRTVPITITGPGGTSSYTASIPQGEEYHLSFIAYPGVTRISLDVEDAISWDNDAYVYLPEKGVRRVLYLGDPGPALAALRSLPDVQVETEGDLSGFQLVVVAGNASYDGRLNRYIDGGGGVIFIASGQGSPEFLPVRITGRAEGPANLWLRGGEFASGLHFDEIGLFSYPEATARRGSTTLVEANGVPVLSYWRIGDGRVIYTGLEMDSDFYMRPEYPILWYQMVNWLTGLPSIDQSNRRTGEVIPLGERLTVQTPSGTLTAASLLLDEVGIYRYRDVTLASNLYDKVESSLSRIAAPREGELRGGRGEALVERDLSAWVMALAILAILLELVIIRWRREA
ncbi:MAG: BatA domain-containing protein [Methanothrix sp.]|nr:BatA domain-containing protein [Methanothrix sp.]